MTVNYSCTTFGELMIPFFSLVEDPENPYREREVKINPITEPFKIPDETVRKFMKENLDAKEKKMKGEGKQFVNNPTARLNAFTVIDEDNHKLELSVQRSDFFTNEMTNKSLDNDIVWRMVEARYESAEIIPVEFKPDKLAPYLVKTVSDVPKGAVRRGNAWIPGRSPASVPAQGKVVIDALIKEYGFDKTYKAIDDAFHDYNKKVA